MGLYLEYNSGDSIAGCSLSRRKGELNQGCFSDECKEGWGAGCWEVVLRPSERVKILLSKSLRMLPTESLRYQVLLLTKAYLLPGMVGVQ